MKLNSVRQENPNLDSIAKRLLEENCLLTALELYAELSESGKECKRLRNYFSNPANFDFRTGAAAGCKFEMSPLGSQHGLRTAIF